MPFNASRSQRQIHAREVEVGDTIGGPAGVSFVVDAVERDGDVVVIGGGGQQARLQEDELVWKITTG